MRHRFSKIPVRYVVYVAVALGALTVAYSYAYAKNDTSSIAKINTCFPLSKEEERTCLEAIVRPLLAIMTAGELMEELQQSLDHLQCHRTGHVIGSELRQQHGSLFPALDQCTAACTSGCIHGVVYQDLIHTFGDYNIDTVNMDFVKSEGVQACNLGIHACHGVGHLLYRLYKSYIPALEYCKTFATEGQRDMCQNGVFMESYPAVKSGELSAVTLESLQEPEELLYPCHGLPSEFFAPCYRLVYLNQWALFDMLGLDDYTTRANKTFEACLSLSRGEERQYCLIGAGQQIARTSKLSDPTSYCRNLDLVEDRRKCNFGFAMASVNYGRVENAWNYCEAAAHNEKHACYYGIFSGTLVPDSNLEPSQACSGTHDQTCREALEIYDTVHRTQYLGGA